MDSVTQFLLGAAVGTAVLGRRMGPRKAAVVGGLLGSLPDLDVVVPFEDPVDAFVLHRGPSHSLIVHAVVTPLFGEALVRGFKDLRTHRWQTYLAVYLCFATHALLDALTVYGTRLFWPLWPEPVGIGSLFIIDPLYSLPLLVAVVWALCLKAWTPRFRKILASSLVFTTAYLAWSLAAQQVMQARGAAALAEAGVEPQRLMAIPTPFNTLFWQVLAVEEDRHISLYLPVFGRGEAISYVHPRNMDAGRCLQATPAFQKLADFSKGFFRVERQDGEILIADLRMGLNPGYVFRFAIAREVEGAIEPMPPERRRSPRTAPGDFDWLIANVTGQAVRRASEASAAVEVAALTGSRIGEAPTAAC